MKTVFLQSTGEIVGRFRAIDGITIDLTGYEEPTGIADGDSNPETDYVIYIGGVPTIVLRPLVPELLESPVGTWSATGCPDGMNVAVWDADLGTLLADLPAVAGAVEVTLVDPGIYRLTSSAPFPYISRTIQVEIV